MRLGRLFVVALSCWVCAKPALATTITIVNTDSAGTGLNDPTPATPVGGNTGTTKGAQALQAFQFAAGIWAETISSAVEIEVDASFAPLSCTEFSGTLGSAGPETVHFGFVGAPDASTWYVQSVANAISGTDLKPATSDIGMEFNGDLGSSGCLESLSWYMGLDAGAPGGTISLASVALHEIGHGLGFLSLVDLATGEKFNGGDDAYMVNLKDFSTGETYDDMTDGERVAASINTGDLRWIGAEVVAASGFLTSGRDTSGNVEIYAPAPQEAGSSVSHWSTSLSPDELMEPTYTGPVIDVGLAAELMLDVGWTAAPPTPTPTPTPVPGPTSTPTPQPECGEGVTGRGEVFRPLVKATNFAAGAGDDKLKYRATLIFDDAVSISPQDDGFLLLVEDGNGDLLVDLDVPAGLYDPVDRSGWVPTPNGRKYQFLARTPVSGMIPKVVLKWNPKKANEVVVIVRAKKGDFALSPVALPLKATVFLKPSDPVTTLCAEAEFPGPKPLPYCKQSGNGASVRCR